MKRNHPGGGVRTPSGYGEGLQGIKAISPANALWEWVLSPCGPKGLPAGRLNRAMLCNEYNQAGEQPSDDRYTCPDYGATRRRGILNIGLASGLHLRKFLPLAAIK